MAHFYHETLETSQTPVTTKPKWVKTIVGNDAIVYEKQLDPLVMDLMPNETDTFIDVGLIKLSYVRFIMLISKIAHKLGLK
jgi:hypothetical protein